MDPLQPWVVKASKKGVTYITPSYPVPTQLTMTWCWAAVATSILRHGRGLRRRQCWVVDACVPLKMSACSTPTPRRACVRMSLTKVLRSRFGITIHVQTASAAGLAPLLPALVHELKAGCPPAIELDVNGGNHVALVGAVGRDAVGNDVVVIADPARNYEWMEVWVDSGRLHREYTTLKSLGLWR